MIITSVINRLLQLDHNLQLLLAPLQHKVVKISCSDFPSLALYASFDLTQISLELNRTDLAVDTNINGSLASFSEFLQSPTKPLSSLGIEIYGDLAVAQNLAFFIKNLDLDWEEYLAAHTNDQISQATSKILKTTLKTLSAQAKSLIMITSDYLNHDSQLIANGDSLEEFYTMVANLRLAVDRLAARMDYYVNT